MRSIWGAVTEISDLGVVAERCPQCEHIMPCLLRSVVRGNYVFFVKTTETTMERSCLCTGCLKAFPCAYWRYAAVVTIKESRALKIDDLLARTNPGLAERIQMQEQITALGGDERFAVLYGRLEEMRPGPLRSSLLHQLLDWDRLKEEQRVLLEDQISARTRAWQFARDLAPAFPGQAVWLTVGVVVLIVGSMFLWVPAVRSRLWGSITVVAGLGAAAFINHLLHSRWVCQWTRKVLIPEAQGANISLDCFVAVVDDVPGSRLSLMEDLWPMKDQLETIRGVLIAERKLQTPAT